MQDQEAGVGRLVRRGVERELGVGFFFFLNLEFINLARLAGQWLSRILLSSVKVADAHHQT